MDEILIYSTIIAALGILLFALYFAKSKSPSTDERERVRRRAAIPNRDEDGHIIADQERLVAAGPRGRRGARLQRRPQVAPHLMMKKTMKVMKMMRKLRRRQNWMPKLEKRNWRSCKQRRIKRRHGKQRFK